MNLWQFFVLYVLVLIIVNFWIRMLIKIFEMVVNHNKRKNNPSNVCGVSITANEICICIFSENKIQLLYILW